MFAQLQFWTEAWELLLHEELMLLRSNSQIVRIETAALLQDDRRPDGMFWFIDEENLLKTRTMP